MITTIDLTTNLTPLELLNVFDNVTVLDAVHGSGNWTFDTWRRHRSKMKRRGVIHGVSVPAAFRFLNGGKDSIECSIKQKYSIDMDTIKMVSKLKPKILGAELVRNTTTFDIVPSEGWTTRGSMIRCTIKNTCFLPPPMKAAAENAMADMSRETIELLVCGVRQADPQHKISIS